MDDGGNVCVSSPTCRLPHPPHPVSPCCMRVLNVLSRVVVYVRLDRKRREEEEGGKGENNFLKQIV